MFTVAPISSRNQFGPLLNSKGLLGEIVEIGCHRGDFTRILLDTWLGKVIHCVDPWSVLPGYEDQAKGLVSSGNTQEFRDRDYLTFKELTSRGILSHRIRIHRCTSNEALEEFNNDSLDFVYLDGDHRYQSVLSDITGWWDKLRVGGILAGHDIICPGEVKGGWGRDIQHALGDWTDSVFPKYEQEPEIHLVCEENGLPWSWYIEKVE